MFNLEIARFAHYGDDVELYLIVYLKQFEISIGSLHESPYFTAVYSIFRLGKFGVKS